MLKERLNGKNSSIFCHLWQSKNKRMKAKRSNRWVFIPVILSFVILGAHFSRSDQIILVILSLGLPLLLAVRKPWSLWIIQLALLLGSIEWVKSTIAYIDVRKAIGEDWHRLAIILFSVAAFTLISGTLLFLVKQKTKK